MSAESVTVYNFRVVEAGIEAAHSSHFKATREAIAESFGNDPIEATVEDVPSSEIADDGTYRRLESQWGSLELDKL